MARLGRVLGICGFVALLSVPMTLFLWDWRFTWIAVAKLLFGLPAIAFWLATNAGGIRETFQGRSTFYWTFTILFVLVVVFGLVVVNYVFHVRPCRFDLTEEKMFSLSDQTSSLLGDLDDAVEVRAFYRPADPEFGLVRTYLERYRYGSEKFVYEFVDPDERPDLVAKYNINPLGPRIVLTLQEREERVKIQRGAPVEQAITTALLNLTGPEVGNRVCFTTGHGEISLSGDDPERSMSAWARHLQSEGYQAETISLLELPAVPPACKAVVAAGPARDLTPDEIQSLQAYLGKGGKLMVLVGATDSGSLTGMLGKYGMRVGADTVIFPRGRSPVLVATDPIRYPRKHPIFSRFFHDGAVLNHLQAVFPLARSVRQARSPAGLEVVELAFSTDNAGSVPMAVAVERRAGPGAGVGEAGGTRLAVFGSSRMAADAAYRRYPFNSNLLMNTLAWLTRQEKKITIRPRFRAASLLRLDESQRKFITFFASDLLPLLILALGISIWQMRRWS